MLTDSLGTDRRDLLKRPSVEQASDHSTHRFAFIPLPRAGTRHLTVAAPVHTAQRTPDGWNRPEIWDHLEPLQVAPCLEHAIPSIKTLEDRLTP